MVEGHHGVTSFTVLAGGSLVEGFEERTESFSSIKIHALAAIVFEAKRTATPTASGLRTTSNRTFFSI
jgi:hypothetical protein